LDYFYFHNLPDDFEPRRGGEATRSDNVTPDIVKKAVKEIRRELSNPATKSRPVLAGRNLYVLLEEDNVAGGDKLSRALRPYWEPLWKLGGAGALLHEQPADSREAQTP